LYVPTLTSHFSSAAAAFAACYWVGTFFVEILNDDFREGYLAGLGDCKLGPYCGDPDGWSIVFGLAMLKIY
jgi:hypothetical protein